MTLSKKITFPLLIFCSLFASAQLCISPSYTYNTGGPTFFAISADFNNDGKPDVATASNPNNNISILIGTGTGSFSAPTNFSVGNGPFGVSTADFNGDGNADLAVPNNGSSDISVLLGNGVGGFSSTMNYTVGGSGTQWVAIADYNNDGKLDIAASVKWSTICILLGNGSGGFSSLPSFSVSSGSGGSLKSADFDKDGNMDLVVCNSGVSVLFGNGTGTFSSPINYTVGSNPSGIIISDFNSDGEKDIATSNYLSYDVSVLLGNGAGGFGSTTNFPIVPIGQAQGIEQVDLNADGNIDIAVTTSNTHTLSVLLGNGIGGFATPIHYAAVALGPRSVVSADFNLDGMPDLVTSAGNNSKINVYLNKTVKALASSTVVCSGGTVSLSGVGATSYTWSSGVTNGIAFTPTTTLTYTVTGNNIGCPINSNTINVVVNPTPTISITSSSGVLCSGESSTLSAMGALSYTWNPGGSGSSITVSPTNTSTYAVTGSSLGCSSTNSIIISVNSLPTLSVSSSSDTLCTGETATLTVNGAITYSWNPGGSGSTISISPTINTTYTVSGIDGNGCSDTASITQIISACVGINELNAEDFDIKVYPNPFHNKMMVSSSGLKTKIQIFDVLGSCVFSGVTENEKTEIDLGKLNSGIYYLRIGSAIKKIIKE